MDSRRSLGMVIVLATVLVGASVALAAEQTRESYKAAVEPICKLNAEKNARVLRGVRAEVKAGELKRAGIQFARAASGLRNTLTELSAVPKPAADSTRLTKWLAAIKVETSLLQRVAREAKAENKGGVQRVAVRLTTTMERANNQVLEFEFRSCRAKPSQFT